MTTPCHDPALAAAERPGLGDGHYVAHLGLVVLVVRDEFRGLALALAVEFVPHLSLDGDNHRLLHLVADHGAGQLCFDAHISPMGEPEDPPLLRCCLKFLLQKNRLDARQVAANISSLARRFELPHRLLDPDRKI